MKSRIEMNGNGYAMYWNLFPNGGVGPATPAGQDFATYIASQFPVFHVWDDHDYGTNDGNKEFAGRADALQAFQEYYPTPELANHRTPVGQLYATGAGWHPGPNGGSGEAYNCYKIIAADMELDNPWRKLGSDETDSLVAEVRKVIQRARNPLKGEEAQAGGTPV